MPGAESPIFARTYDLLRWLIPLTTTFPRQHRFVLAEAVQRTALGLHERMIEAVHGEARQVPQTLEAVEVELSKLRHYLRLCHDLLLLTASQYEHVATRLEEIGRLLGGWQRAAVQRAKTAGIAMDGTHHPSPSKGPER